MDHGNKVVAAPPRAGAAARSLVRGPGPSFLCRASCIAGTGGSKLPGKSGGRIAAGL